MVLPLLIPLAFTQTFETDKQARSGQFHLRLDGRTVAAGAPRLLGAARARPEEARMEPTMTAYEFNTKHPNAKAFASLAEAMAWQNTAGGVLWHLTSAGGLRRGYATWGTVQYYVA